MRGPSTPETTIGVLAGLPGLSERAARFVRRHPGEARIAVAAALEAAAALHEAVRAGADLDLPEALRPFVVRRPLGPEMIGVPAAAARLRVSRATVYAWIRKKTLLAWKGARRGLVIPAEQLLGPGSVIPGIAEVVKAIGDPELAWTFLTEEWPFADERRRPIDRLRAGEVQQVIDAAPGFGTVFT